MQTIFFFFLWPLNRFLCWSLHLRSINKVKAFAWHGVWLGQNQRMELEGLRRLSGFACSPAKVNWTQGCWLQGPIDTLLGIHGKNTLLIANFFVKSLVLNKHLGDLISKVESIPSNPWGKVLGSLISYLSSSLGTCLSNDYLNCKSKFGNSYSNNILKLDRFI